MKLVFSLILFISFTPFFAQLDAGSVMGIPSTPQLTDLTGAPVTEVFRKGNFAFVEDQNTFYFYDGTQWVSILDTNSKTIVENELFFEDSNFYYVSVIVNTTNWMVSRFSRTDLNTEAFSMGNGAQPSDLATISGLTFM